ncbi:hypothetical protein OSTOST_14715 [Ostertagia ostertagi]
MEWVDGVELRHIFHNVTVNEISDALRALAYLEAVSLQLTDEEKQKVASNPIADIYGPLLPPQAAAKMLLDVGSQSKAWESCCAELSAMATELADMKLPSTLNDELGMKDVMIHGDLWSANLLWKKTESGFELARIVDFQLAHFGCAGRRLNAPTDHDPQWSRPTREMGQSVEGIPREAYRRFFPFAGVILLPVIDAVAKIGARKIVATMRRSPFKKHYMKRRRHFSRTCCTLRKEIVTCETSNNLGIS